MSSIEPKKFSLQNASIQEAKADQTYSQSGEHVSNGRSMKRLVLGNDSRLNIAVGGKLSRNSIIGTFQRVFLNLRHVEVKVGDQTIYANVNSLAKRLHLSKSDILQASKKEGELEQLIDQKTPHLSSILDGYTGIFKSYQDNNEMLGKAGINAESLMQIVSVAVPTLLSNGTEVLILTSNKDFIAEFGDDQKNLRLTFLEKLLGEGTFGSVSRTVTLRSEGQQVGVLKKAKDSNIARDDVKKEYDMLVWLHSDPKVPAPPSIQAKPHKFVNILQSYGGNDVGYRGEIYVGGDLKNAFQEPIGKKMQRGLSMMEGVAYLHQRGIVHKDLKPANFLINDKNTVVSDLGGARALEEYSKMNVFDIGTHTSAYTSRSAVIRAENNFGKDQKAFEESLKQNDAFSTAVSIYRLFTGSLPYKLDKDSYAIPQPLTNLQKGALRNQGVPEDIINLLDEMISGPIPTMSEAYARYKAAFGALNYLDE